MFVSFEYKMRASLLEMVFTEAIIPLLSVVLEQAEGISSLVSYLIVSTRCLALLRNQRTQGKYRIIYYIRWGYNSCHYVAWEPGYLCWSESSTSALQDTNIRTSAGKWGHDDNLNMQREAWEWLAVWGHLLHVLITENILWMWFAVHMGSVNDLELFHIRLEHPVEKSRELSRAVEFRSSWGVDCHVAFWGGRDSIELVTTGSGDKIACLSTWFRSFRYGTVCYRNSTTALLCPVSEMQHTQMQLFCCTLQCWGRKHVPAHSAKKPAVCSDKLWCTFYVGKTRPKPRWHVKITCIGLNQLYNNCTASWIAAEEGCAVDSEESL